MAECEPARVTQMGDATSGGRYLVSASCSTYPWGVIIPFGRQGCTDCRSSPPVFSPTSSREAPDSRTARARANPLRESDDCVVRGCVIGRHPLQLMFGTRWEETAVGLLVLTQNGSRGSTVHGSTCKCLSSQTLLTSRSYHSHQLQRKRLCRRPRAAHFSRRRHW